MPMKTSPAGVAAIRQREGCRLHAYRDSVGVLTIGVGHTGRASPPAVYEGMTISQDEADTILAGDLTPFERAVNEAIKLPMTQAQFDACTSLAFNVGAHGFTGSTVVRDFNRGDPQAAADAFLMWERPPELRGRRIGERAQFLMSSPVATTDADASDQSDDTDNAPAASPPPPSPAPVASAAGAHITGIPASAPASVPPPSQTFVEWLSSLFFRRPA